MAEIIFYKAGWSSPIIPDLAICLRTLSTFSHVELRFAPDEIFSASWFDGRGVRLKKEAEVKAEEWDRFAIIAPKDKIADMRAWCQMLHHERINDGSGKYDLVGVLWWSRQVDNLDKWFCSEVCMQALVRACILPNERRFKKMSPGSAEKYCSHDSKNFQYLDSSQPFFTDRDGDTLWRHDRNHRKKGENYATRSIVSNSRTRRRRRKR